MSGLAAFVAGLGGGYLKAQQQNREDERQDKRDAMLEEQFAWARDDAGEKRREREAKEAERQILRDGAKAGQIEDNVAGVTYTDQAGQQRTAYQPDQATADFAAQQQRLEEGSAPQAPAVASNPTATTATSVRDLTGNRKLFTGLTAAADAKRFADENPNASYAQFNAMAQRVLATTGNQELADKLLERAKKAEKEGAFKALAMLEAGNTDAALNAWNSTGAARLQPGQKFTTVSDKAGNKIHQVVNEDGSVAVPNVESALLNYIGGIEGVTRRADAKAKELADMRKELMKPVPLNPGQVVTRYNPQTDRYEEVASNTAPPRGYEDVTDPNTGVTRRVPVGKADKPGDYPKVIADTFKGDESKIAQANELYDRLLESNPGMKPAAAAGIAQRALSGGRVVQTFNPQTGLFERHFEDSAGAVADSGASLGSGAAISNGTYRLGASQYKKGAAGVSDKDAQAAVAQIQKDMPTEYSGYVNIVKTPESYQAYINKAGETLSSLKSTAEKNFSEAKTPEEKAQIQALYQQTANKITAELRRVELVKQFYKPTPDTNKGNSDPQAAQKKPGFLQGMFAGTRINYLEGQLQRGTISKPELAELEMLKANRGNEWWRGRASEAQY